MNYLELLRFSADRFKSIVCLGLDPVIDDIPISGKPGEVIYTFYEAILNEIVKKGIFPSAVKPNYAFYAQYGLEGITCLVEIIKIYSNEGLPVILDVKRGDIGKTAKAYAGEAFDFFNADAVTLSPYMGYDSVGPFIEKGPDKGYYILTKTSNKSSSDFQDIEVNNEPIYMHVADKILDWYHPGIGSVVGATYPDQLKKISNIFNSSGKDVPFLIPGVGTQGGDLKEILTILKEGGNENIHRINSSSAINYAYKKNKAMAYDEAAVKALKLLNEEIGTMLYEI